MQAGHSPESTVAWVLLGLQKAASVAGVSRARRPRANDLPSLNLSILSCTLGH